MEDQSSLLCEMQNLVAESVSDPIGLKQLFSESKEGELRWERNVAGIKIKSKYSLNSIITACILAASMVILIFVPSIFTLALGILIGILSAFSFGKSNLNCSMWILIIFCSMHFGLMFLSDIITYAEVPETIWWLREQVDVFLKSLADFGIDLTNIKISAFSSQWGQYVFAYSHGTVASANTLNDIFMYVSWGSGSNSLNIITILLIAGGLLSLVIRKLQKKFSKKFPMTKSYVLQCCKTKGKARIAAFAIGILSVVTVYFYGIGFML